MGTKSETPVKSSVPEGYKSLAGNLPPFVSLDIGQILHGQIYRHRVTTKDEKIKVKGGKVETITKTKHFLDMTLIDAGTYNVGTIKRPSIKEFEKGEVVTLSLGSGVFNPLAREMFNEEGKPSDYWPEMGEEFPELKWDVVIGRPLYVRREKDGVVKKGDFAGNKRNTYTVALGPKA